MKIEQRKVRGWKWGPQVEQTALIASPIYIGQAQGEEKAYKKRSQRAEGLSLSLSLSLCCPSLFLSLFSSCLWVGMPLCLEDVFSCYFLNKSELQHGAVTLICLRAITLSVQDLRTITRFVQELCLAEGFNVHRFKFLLRWDRTEEITLTWQIHTSFFMYFLFFSC